MKKLMGMLILLIGSCAIADDSYLYWMLSDDGNLTWDSIKITANTDSGSSVLTIFDTWTGNQTSYGESLSSTQYNSDKDFIQEYIDDNGLPAYWASLGGLSDIESFVLELYNGSELVKSSDVLSYSGASSYMLSSGITIIPAGMTPYPFIAPEPTSGVMVLIGGVLLALRRKRKIIA